MKIVRFCSGKRCCPTVKLYSETRDVVIEDDTKPENGSITMTKSQFMDFVSAAKSNKFKDILNG